MLFEHLFLCLLQWTLKLIVLTLSQHFYWLLLLRKSTLRFQMGTRAQTMIVIWYYDYLKVFMDSSKHHYLGTRKSMLTFNSWVSNQLYQTDAYMLEPI